MFVEEITYGTLVGGRTEGVMAFTIQFGGDAAQGDELLDVVDAIYRHRRAFGKAIRLQGAFTEDNTLDVLTLIRSLKNAGYLVAALVDGERFHSWFSYLHYIIVETKVNRWIGFEANELWYHMDEDGIEELTIPEVSKQPELYVVPGPEVTPNGIFRFIKDSKRVWNVMLTPERPFVEMVAYTAYKEPTE